MLWDFSESWFFGESWHGELLIFLVDMATDWLLVEFQVGDIYLPPSGWLEASTFKKINQCNRGFVLRTHNRRNLKMSRTCKHIMPAPTVPVADTDGLIKLVDLESDVVINFLAGPIVVELDSFQVLLNGELVGDPVKMPAPVPEGTELSLFISVANHLIEDGVYAVGYSMTTYPGNTRADSESTYIKIDRTPPGAALLAPMLVPDVTLSETLTATLAGYAGMAPEDIVQTLCNDTQGPTFTVQAEHLTNTPVTIQFERRFLQTLDSEEVTLSYQVTDRAGNVSRTSEPVTLTLQV
ncbi:hypothetical protein [Pseudomonas sp. NA-150]|uniref:hypothetical protein n=1 Tax=Pseudomonas sp. NA-150 TaxID=3367525 RepID=UPI0037CA78F6